MKNNNNLPKIVNETYGDFLRAIDSFFVDAFKNIHSHGFFAPSIPINMYETDRELVIEAELAGVSKEQILLDVLQNHIRIRVKHEEIIESSDENQHIIQKKSTYSARERMIPIPYPINRQNVKATFNNGLLQIRIPNGSNPINID